jgi:hypothetical protein
LKLLKQEVKRKEQTVKLVGMVIDMQEQRMEKTNVYLLNMEDLKRNVSMDAGKCYIIKRKVKI